MSAAPEKVPCVSCPYRCDVPSGVWAQDEYEKLPAYDLPTGEQEATVFFCHQRNGHICSGWASTHDMENNLGLRVSVLTGLISEEDADATIEYESPVPLFKSGQEAYEHGVRDLKDPSVKARKIVSKLVKRKDFILPVDTSN